jgi:subtilase family serine protease
MPVTFHRHVGLCATLLFCAAGAAIAAPLPSAAPLVRGVVSDSMTLAFPGDRPEILAKSYDEGPLNDKMLLPHIRLVLKRPAGEQAALDALTHDQHTRGAASYHRWLKPGDLRAYGPAQADITKAVLWLMSHHLRVNSVSPSGMAIDFGGRAGDVAAAFHTPLHYVTHAGEAHISNISAPRMPAALAPVVTGVTLSNFFPKPALRPITPSFTKTISGRTFYAVTPADFATIYNVTPLRGSANFYGAPITGAGVTLAVVEQTKIQSADWVTFRKTFGLSAYPGTLTQVNPGGCTSPGTTGDEIEAAIDVEWSSAVAPAANIIEASCEGTAPFEFGVMTSLQNLVEVSTPATILSISYGGPEVAFGYAFMATWTNLLEEGAAEGKAIFVSSGDQGVSADRGEVDSNGLFVNGLADSAYNVSVGGTDFYDTALHENPAYWKPDNSITGGSAISYVPEIPWDNSCSNAVNYTFLKAFGPIEFCNTATGAKLQNGVGGSGSESVYYTKPDWQLTSVLGMPNDGVRDQPDVSLFAANGFWNHFYLECMSDSKEGGVPCDYSNPNDFLGSAYGGTSFGAPAFAGITALIQQTYDPANGPVVPLGNPAPVFYAVAQAQFSTPLGLSGCNATLGNKISSACVFQYTTAGDITEPCFATTPNCATDAHSTQGIGVIRTTVAGKGQYAYPAQPGYSLATGLGSVNVTNLLYSFYLGL